MTNIKATSIANKNKQMFCQIPESFSPKFSPVIFNEIAWAGTSKSSSDEWIELKNKSNQIINLNNWQIIGQDLKNKKIKLKIKLKGKISPNNFFLLERTDDNTIPEIKADLIYQGALNNSDYQIFLFDDHCQIIDIIKADSEWPAGSTIDRKTMERSPNLSWHTYYGSGTPFKGLIIYGTPKAPNSIKLSISSPKESSSQKKQSINWCPLTNKINLPTNSSVIFNEIAWMGNASNTYDEWLELKLVTTSKINLQNWQIISQNNGKISLQINLENSILTTSSSYFVLEKNNSHPALANIANQTYTGSSLPNNPKNYQLFLFDNHCQLVDYLEASSSWPAGSTTNKEYRSMEKDSSGWHTYSQQAKTINNFKIFGTPGKKNSLPAPPIATSTKNQSPIQSPSSTKNSKQIKQSQIILKNIKISEVFLGSSSTKEQFIELYNTSSSPINLKNFSLQYIGGSTRAKTFHKLGSKTKPLGIIPARGFYLVASSLTILGKKADFVFLSNFSLSTAKSGGTIALLATTTLLSSTSTLQTPLTIDRLAYGSGNIYPENKATSTFLNASYERKAFSTSTTSNYPTWQFAGNSYDSQNNSFDFIKQTIPNPQNSQNLPEPRQAPKIPKNFVSTYNQDLTKINFSWQFSSSSFYQLSFSCQPTSTKNILAFGLSTSTYSTSSHILNNCQDRGYFFLKACDKNNLCSKSATSSLKKQILKNPYLKNVKWYFDSNNKLKILFTAATSTKITLAGIIDGQAINNWRSAVYRGHWIEYTSFHLNKASSTINRTYYLNFKNQPLDIVKNKQYSLEINDSYFITSINPSRSIDFLVDRKLPQKGKIGFNDYLNFFIKDKTNNLTYLDNSQHYFGNQKIEITSPINYFNTTSSQIKINFFYTNVKNSGFSKIYLTLYQKELGPNEGKINWQNKLAVQSKDILTALTTSSNFEINLPTSGLYIVFLSFAKPITNLNQTNYTNLNINYSDNNLYIKDLKWQYVNERLKVSFVGKINSYIQIIPFINLKPELDKNGFLKSKEYEYWEAILNNLGMVGTFRQRSGYIVTSYRNNIGTFQDFLCPIAQDKNNYYEWQANGLANKPTVFEIKPSSTYSFNVTSLYWRIGSKIYAYNLPYNFFLNPRRVKSFFEHLSGINKNGFTNQDYLYLYIEEYDKQLKQINRMVTNKPYYFKK